MESLELYFRSTRLRSSISLRITLELYLIVAICLVENSRIWATSLVLFTSSTLHLIPSSFSSSLKWERRHVGMSILTGNIVFSQYTNVKGVSPWME